jgi:arylsulfatase A-like enzyme
VTHSRFTFAALMVAMLLACGSHSKDVPDASIASAAPAKTVEPEAPSVVVVDFLKGGASCSLGHRGTLIDFGDTTLRRVRVRGTKDAHVEAKPVEHGGATWLKISGREVSAPFQAPLDAGEDARTFAVGLRAQGGTARSVSMYVNGKAVGAIKLARGEISSASLKVTGLKLKPTENELSLRFNGMGRGSDTAAELDWARIGVYDDESPYAAPTRNDAIDTIRIHGEPRRALSVKGPGFARCVSYLPKGAKLSTALGLSGGGEADVEIRVLRDRKPPQVLANVHLQNEQAWRPIDLPLGDESSFAEVQLVAVQATKGARVSFAEPKVVAARNAANALPMKNAKSAIVVVLGSIDPKTISTYGGSIEVPELGALASGGLVFDAHRSSGNTANAALASLMTSLEVDEHGVIDSSTRLPSSLTTLADCAREGGIQTAYFSGNPLTGSAFGIERGFGSFEATDPTNPASVTKVFEMAADWITAHRDGRFLVVVHARGGHPPWETTREDLKDMPPTGYAGAIEARHAGEILSRIRAMRDTRFTDNDKVRMWALYSLGVRQNDAALGRLMTVMRSLKREEDTAVFVTSDLSPDPSAKIPFAEGDAITESGLNAMLVLRPPPGNMIEATRSTFQSSTIDIPTTVLAALGLAPPASFAGVDLWRASNRVNGAELVPRLRYVRSAERYAATWGELLLQGQHRRATRLCDLALEASCASDVRDLYPLAYSRMLSAVEERENRAHPQRETATIDAATASALRIWGKVEHK